VRGEVQLVRETLEGIVEPAVATSVLFESLSRWGKGVPEGAEEVLALVRGPLAELLEARIGPQARGALATLEAQLSDLAQPEGMDVDVEIDLDVDEPGDDPDEMTAQMAAVQVPVKVLVMAGYGQFAHRLNAAIGSERCHAVTVSSVEELTRTVFRLSPQIVVIDASQPAAIRTLELSNAIKGLPDAMLSFVWSADSHYGRDLRSQLLQTDCDTMFLDRDEGIEPLLDLVLSRFKTTTLPPPPDL